MSLPDHASTGATHMNPVDERAIGDYTTDGESNDTDTDVQAVLRAGLDQRRTASGCTASSSMPKPFSTDTEMPDADTTLSLLHGNQTGQSAPGPEAGSGVSAGVSPTAVLQPPESRWSYDRLCAFFDPNNPLDDQANGFWDGFWDGLPPLPDDEHDIDLLAEIPSGDVPIAPHRPDNDDPELLQTIDPALLGVTEAPYYMRTVSNSHGAAQAFVLPFEDVQENAGLGQEISITAGASAQLTELPSSQPVTLSSARLYENVPHLHWSGCICCEHDVIDSVILFKKGVDKESADKLKERRGLRSLPTKVCKKEQWANSQVLESFESMQSRLAIRCNEVRSQFGAGESVHDVVTEMRSQAPCACRTSERGYENGVEE